jgi:hypothetical protein
VKSSRIHSLQIPARPAGGDSTAGLAGLLLAGLLLAGLLLAGLLLAGLLLAGLALGPLPQLGGHLLRRQHDGRVIGVAHHHGQQPFPLPLVR